MFQKDNGEKKNITKLTFLNTVSIVLKAKKRWYKNSIKMSRRNVLELGGDRCYVSVRQRAVNHDRFEVKISKCLC